MDTFGSLPNVGKLKAFVKLVLINFTGFIIACRVQDVAELLGMMVEDHKRLQPNMRTYT